MQLGVREVAKLLMVSEATVYRWLKQGRIPSTKVLDEHRFNRAELLEWATAQGLAVSPAIFDQAEDASGPLPHLSEAMKLGGIHYRLSGDDKPAVLAAVVERLHLPVDIDRGLLLKFLLAREELGSTGIGEGIAIPHVRNPIILNVPQSIIALCFLEKPVDFAALDGQPVQCLFTLITPTVRVHLHLLSRLSYALRYPEFRDALTRRAAETEILAQLAAVEDKISALKPNPQSP